MDPVLNCLPNGCDICAETDVKLFLYTRRNPKNPQRLCNNNPTSISNSNFVPSKPTNFIIHGWNYKQNENPEVKILLRDAFLKTIDCNVIYVDWTVGASKMYPRAAECTKVVAAFVASFIDFLATHFGAKLKNVLIAGHSLGAHVAGFVGKKVRMGKIGKIVALDPASPLFHRKNSEGRVDKDDADDVEVIHTSTWGIENPIGNRDYYANFGREQPGCGIDFVGNCAHGRAVELYAESIIAGGLPCSRCANYSEISRNKCTIQGAGKMGGSQNKDDAEGVYYVETNSEPPYSKNQKLSKAKDYQRY